LKRQEEEANGAVPTVLAAEEEDGATTMMLAVVAHELPVAEVRIILNPFVISIVNFLFFFPSS
jgi:membrane protein CcdC involved in cytochrome C biogenesis